MSIKNKTLRLILGDQLNINHSWFAKVESNVTYVLMEIRSETDYTSHHIQKVIGIFTAMQTFAKELQQKNHDVLYIKLNDEDNFHRFDENVVALINKYKFNQFEYLLPDEYRVDEHLKAFTQKLKLPTKVYDTEHFYSTRTELGDLFVDKKTYLMETFYRHMRKKHKVLVDDESKPLLGKWNFDEDNRQKLPKSHKPIIPLVFSNNVTEIENEIVKSKIKTIGKVNSKYFIWPINRKQSLELLDFFTTNCLQLFGTFQDAMAPNEWSVYHSRLSFSMNIKLISPKEVVYKAIEVYNKNVDQIAFHQLEGFVMQII